MSDVGTWSVIAEKNNKPAPNGWRENMAPSDVNDTARENMAAVKRMTLDLPYVSMGGVVSYVDAKTFTIDDDDLNSNYSSYYVVGRQVKVKYTTGSPAVPASMVGTVAASTYSGGTSTITLFLPEALPSTVSDVLVGLQLDDVTNLTGPNMLGMILPFTCDPDNIPFGMGYADGEPFDPLIYVALADLYYTGDDDSGNPQYRYGQEEVSGRWWPKKPDARGYFPRFLDDRTEGAVDQDAPRTAGSTQAYQAGSHGHNLWAFSGFGGAYAGLDRVVSSTTFASGAERALWSGVADTYSTIAIRKEGDNETRPVNMAFTPLLVMYGGYVSADQVKPEALVNRVMADVQPQFDQQNAYIDQRLKEIEQQAIGGNAATEVEYGIVKLASSADIETGANETNVITVKTLTPIKQEVGDIKQEVDDIKGSTQPKAKQITTTLTVSGWGSDNTQTVAVAGMTADDLVVCSPAGDKDSVDAWAAAGVYAQTQAENALTFVCDSVPSSDINIKIGVFPQ